METKKTILIADTSEEFRTILADALQAEEGLEVVGQTSDGQEAIQMVLDALVNEKTGPQISWSWTWCWGGWTALTCWTRSSPNR